MADTNSSNLGCENDCDDQDTTPEHLLPSEPVQDPYNSDNSLETCNKAPCHSISEEENEIKFAGDLDTNYAKNQLMASFSSQDGGKSQELMDRSDFSDCLAELLEFCLFESNRRNVNQNGVKTYDGCTVEEIISKWNVLKPNLKWLLEHFHQDLDTESLLDVDNVDSFHKISQLLLPRPLNESSVEVGITEAKKDLDERLCAQFAQRFLSIRSYIGQNQNQKEVNSCSDEVQDNFKALISLMVGFIGIFYCECEETVNILEVNDKCDVGRTYRLQHVTCRPDLALCSPGDEITVPVQIFVPQIDEKIESLGQEKNKLTIDLKINKSTQKQEDVEKNINMEHLFQHLSLMVKTDHRNMENVHLQTEPRHEDMLSVGMLFKENRLYFTKVKTPLVHMKSLITTEAQLTEILTIGNKLSQRRKTELKVIQSNYSLDIWRGSHRNALLFFLAHYLHAPVCGLNNIKLEGE